MKTKILLLVGLLLILLVSDVHPAGNRSNLTGLRGVGVVVEMPGALLQKEGVGTSQLQTRVEVKLRQAGIVVLTEKERHKTPGRPYLYLSITSVKIENVPSLAVGISLELQELVLLERQSKSAVGRLSEKPGFTEFAATWSTGMVGIYSTDKVRLIYDGVGDVVDRFINDYLAANAK